jgi:hypothetical protein
MKLSTAYIFGGHLWAANSAGFIVFLALTKLPVAASFAMACFVAAVLCWRRGYLLRDEER